jgi:hypothetical protein
METVTLEENNLYLIGRNAALEDLKDPTFDRDKSLKAFDAEPTASDDMLEALGLGDYMKGYEYQLRLMKDFSNEDLS